MDIAVANLQIKASKTFNMCVYACLPLCIHKSERKEMIAQYLPISFFISS